MNQINNSQKYIQPIPMQSEKKNANYSIKSTNQSNNIRKRTTICGIIIKKKQKIHRARRKLKSLKLQSSFKNTPLKKKFCKSFFNN